MTTVQTFKGRDQITKIRRYSGTTSSSTFQNGMLTYDGQGRIKTRHCPVEGSQTENNPVGSVRFDFDNDGKADLARWKSSATKWKVKNSSTGNFTTLTIASSSSLIVPADLAVWRSSSGVWWILGGTGSQQFAQAWGQAGDIPVPNDYDGDGKVDIAVWRSANGNWYIRKSSTGNIEEVNSEGNVFVEKEFDEDGRVKRVTNLFRTHETKIWTTNVYDESSRIKEVVLPDGAKT